MNWAIETYNLCKSYPQQRGWRKSNGWKSSPLAVDQVNLQIRPGELFGLVGPNGAGKTTLIKLLCTLVQPNQGSALINGFSLDHPQEILRSIGLWTGDERSFHWRLTGRQNLEFFAALHGIHGPRKTQMITTVLEQVGLPTETADQHLHSYPNGMRQRLGIARALLHQPKILFLDEPTNNLDPLAVSQLHHLIRDQLVAQHGITVFLTTHQLNEAEKLCDRIAIMHQGQIKACGSLPELRQLVNSNEEIALRLRGDPASLQAIRRQLFPNAAHRTRPGGEIELTLQGNTQQLPSILARAEQMGGQVVSVERRPIPLESIFSQVIHLPATQHAPQTKAHSLHHASPTQPKPHNAVRNLISTTRVAWAFLKRDFRAEVSYRVAFALQFLNLIFSMGVFFFLSRLIGPAAKDLLSSYGGDYFAFVLIGIALSGYFGVGLSSFARSLRQAQTTGTLEAMLTTPARPTTLILSSTLWSYLMTTLQVALYILLGSLFLDFPLAEGNYPLSLFVLMLTIGAFSSLGILAASFIMVLKRGDPITWIFSGLAGLLGGVYYPIRILPPWLQQLARVFPITHALEAMRQTVLRGATAQELVFELGILALFCLPGLPLSLLVFNIAVRWAKYEGSLTHY